MPYGYLLVNPTIGPNLFCHNDSGEPMLDEKTGPNISRRNMQSRLTAEQPLHEAGGPPDPKIKHAAKLGKSRH